MTKALRIPLLIVGLLVAGYVLIRNISVSLTIPDEAVAVTGGALSVIAVVIAAILLMLSLAWLLSRIRLPERAAVAPMQSSTPSPMQREVIRRPSILGKLVGAVLKVILALTVFMALGSAEEFLLSENRRLYPQPDAWWWDHSPPSPMESLASAAAFGVVSFLIVLVLNIRARGEDRGARNVVTSVTVFYVISTLILKFIT